MSEIVMAKLKWRWRRVLAAALCVIVAAVCVYLAWTADPGVSTMLNDGSGGMRKVTVSTAKEIEALRMMVYPEDPSKARYPRLAPSLRQAEHALTVIRTKQTVYVVVAVVLVLVAGVLGVFGRRPRADAEASLTPAHTDAKKKSQPMRRRLAIGLVVGAGLISAFLFLPVESELRLTTTFNTAGPEAAPPADQSDPSDSGEQQVKLGDFTVTARLAKESRPGSADDLDQKAVKLQAEGSELFWSRKTHDQGVALLEQAIALEPRLLPAYGLLARDYRIRLGGEAGIAKAFSLLQRGIAASPQAWELQLELANAYAAVEQHKRAVSLFEKTIALGAADVASVHYNLANSLGPLGRLPEAIASYERALTLAPTHFNARKNLILTLRRAGQIDEAIRHAKGFLDQELDEDRAQWVREALVGLGKDRLASTVDAAIESARAAPRPGRDLKFDVSGRVTKLLVETGQSVKEGQVLAELDKSDFELELKRCQAELEQHKAKTKLMSLGELSGTNVRQTRDALVAKQELAARNLAATVLRAPAAGHVVRVLVEVGEPIKAGESVIVLQTD